MQILLRSAFIDKRTETKMIKPFAQAAILSAGLVAFSASGAFAAATSPPTTARIVPAAYGAMVYNPHIHGNRCGYRSAHCGHYYHGYWYERSWWSVGVAIPGVGVVVGVPWVYNSHVHGHRYAMKRAGYGFHHGGYYYSRPWWTINAN